jgi:hypothetical protein
LLSDRINSEFQACDPLSHNHRNQALQAEHRFALLLIPALAEAGVSILVVDTNTCSQWLIRRNAIKHRSINRLRRGVGDPNRLVEKIVSI